MDVHPVYGLPSRTDIDTPLNSGFAGIQRILQNALHSRVWCLLKLFAQISGELCEQWSTNGFLGGFVARIGCRCHLCGGSIWNAVG